MTASQPTPADLRAVAAAATCKQEIDRLYPTNEGA